MGYTVVCWPAILPHALLEASQTRPVLASQSVVPHAQFAGLAAVPSVLAQATKWWHRLSSATQKSPVADVQAPEAPQTQGAGLAVAPSAWAQAGPVKAAHRQALEEE